MIRFFLKIKFLFFKYINFFSIRLLIPVPKRKRGYNIFGYFSRVMGQAVIARGFVRDVQRAKEKYSLYDIYCNHKRIDRETRKKYSKYSFLLKYDKNVFFIDPVHLNGLNKINSSIFKNADNSIVFWWEFESGFEDKIPLLNKFDTVLVYSEFVKKILQNNKQHTFKIKKIALPHLEIQADEKSFPKIKCEFGIPDCFCFFFNFDYLSSYKRKNPEAVIEAFAKIKTDLNIHLVIKTINSDNFQDKKDQLNRMIDSLRLTSFVTVIDTALSVDKMISLLSSMDCYVSLHRGEGLGLGMLEALQLNIPVIATGYGGNVDFMQNNKLAHLVDYKLVPAQDDYPPYKKVKEWAEPDINQAASQMRKVFKHSLLIENKKK